MKLALTLSVLCLPLISFSQAETFSYKDSPSGKLKYEYQVHKSREYLIDDFFKLFAKSEKVWIMKEEDCVAIARRTKKGFEVVGDGAGAEFACDPANLCIDIWYEYAKVNSQ